MGLFVALGFDCDVPRGMDHVKTDVGKRQLSATTKGLNFIKRECKDIPLTYFICGSFMETLVLTIGLGETQSLFLQSAEIAIHGWSHFAVAPVKFREDKKPLSPEELVIELVRTKLYIEDVLDSDVYGFRTPLGHTDGLKDSPRIVDTIKQVGLEYVSSDLRDKEGGLNPPLLDEKGVRQPYLYHNGLLEIPSHGWQDAVFVRTTIPPLFSRPPRGYSEVISYYEDLINEASTLAKDQNFFLCLVLHPIELIEYADVHFFKSLMDAVSQVNGEFITYGEIAKRENR